MVEVESPPRGWFKLNMDGLVDGFPRKAGAGGVIRDHNNTWIGGFGKSIGDTHGLLAELWAVKEGLMLAKQLNINNIIIELDAKVAMDLILGNAESKLFFTPLLLDCKAIISSFRT